MLFDDSDVMGLGMIPVPSSRLLGSSILHDINSITLILTGHEPKDGERGFGREAVVIRSPTRIQEILLLS